MKVKLVRPWSKAETNDDGAINGWTDHRPGDTVEVPEPVAKALMADGTAEAIAASPLDKLVGSNTRKSLDKKAEKLGIDPSVFSNMTQVAEAILKREAEGTEPEKEEAEIVDEQPDIDEKEAKKNEDKLAKTAETKRM